MQALRSQALRSPARLLGLAVVLLALPLCLQAAGSHWVRSLDLCLLYVMLALGMNVVVGYAGLLDLGYVAFYAMGAYLCALLNSAQLSEHFAWAAALSGEGFTTAWWLTVPMAGAVAALLGLLLGAPTLRLRGDYLAVVTLGFGEVLRLLINNLGAEPVNITNGARGIGPVGPLRVFGLDLSQPLVLGGHLIAPVTQHAYLFLALTLATLLACHRLQKSRIGRAWMAIREDEVAAEAMGIPTSRLKLLAFAVGAGFGGVAGAMFSSFQGFISPESFTLQESIFIVAMVVFGGMGHLPGVLLGAVILAGLPEALRYVAGPLQSWSEGRLDAGVLRPLLIALTMVGTMLVRPHGLWPAPVRR